MLETWFHRRQKADDGNFCLGNLPSQMLPTVPIPTDIVVKQTRQAGCWLTVDIQTSFHSFLLLLVHLKLESKWTQGLEVAPIQSPNCADWHPKHLRVRISGCPPPGYQPLRRPTMRRESSLLFSNDKLKLSSNGGGERERQADRLRDKAQIAKFTDRAAQWGGFPASEKVG